MMAQRPRHKRAYRTENRIFDAYLKLRRTGKRITPKLLARTAGVSRATLYRHHFRLGKVRQTYSKLLLVEYKSMIHGYKKKMSVGQLLYCTLLFISRHEKICCFLLERETLLHKMLECFKKEISAEYHFGKTIAPVFDIYVGEAYAVILNWRKAHFAENLIDIVYHDLIFLAKTAETRLDGVRFGRLCEK